MLSEITPQIFFASASCGGINSLAALKVDISLSNNFGLCLKGSRQQVAFMVAEKSIRLKCGGGGIFVC